MKLQISVKTWVKRNRKRIDAHIPAGRMNDKKRREWVLNDEFLCKLAKSENVNMEVK